MTLIVKYFGMTAEASSKSEETILGNYSTIQELKNALIVLYPKLDNMSFKIAVNQSIVNNDYVLMGNEEVALLPPFAGG
jgi:molybdopterin converting factor small subunit